MARRKYNIIELFTIRPNSCFGTIDCFVCEITIASYLRMKKIVIYLYDLHCDLLTEFGPKVLSNFRPESDLQQPIWV